jgi:hypothetical protein
VNHDRDRLLGRLDKMLEGGRVTEEEARRLRVAADSEDFDEAVREIRLRHATERLGEALDDGRITPEEAATFRERLKNGEDPRFLRGLRRGARPRAGDAQERDQRA